jgi:hypothetical protein
MEREYLFKVVEEAGSFESQIKARKYIDKNKIELRAKGWNNLKISRETTDYYQFKFTIYGYRLETDEVFYNRIKEEGEKIKNIQLHNNQLTNQESTQIPKVKRLWKALFSNFWK